MTKKLIKILVCSILLLPLVACNKTAEKKGNEDKEEERKNTLYQLPEMTTNKIQMMSYVIQTKNNNLIVIDGGNHGDGTYLLSFLKDLSKKDIPQVDSWFFTHPHADHVNSFLEIMNDYRGQVKVNKIYYKFPDLEEIKKHDLNAYETCKAFLDLIEEVGQDKYHIVQVGEKFRVDDIDIEVLFINEPYQESNFVNNSSVAYRFYIDNQSLLILGDLGRESGYKMLAKLKDDLKSDIVQMAHHGNHGIAKEIYKKIDPKICLWPTPVWLWNNDQGKGYDTGPYETIEVYNYMKTLNVKEHYISKDGLSKLVFPLDLD